MTNSTSTTRSTVSVVSAGRWELCRLADGAWSVRQDGQERAILPKFIPAKFVNALDCDPEDVDIHERRLAQELEKLLNHVMAPQTH